MLTLDLRDFERVAKKIQAAADQVPFALANALNTAALNTRDVLINETWPRFMEVRNRNFMRNALRVQKATKRNLEVVITNEGAPAGKRGHLALHGKGGRKPARSQLAIPDKKLLGRRSGKGMPARLTPRGAPNTFKRGTAIFQREGKTGLKLLYTLHSSAPVAGVVPFQSEFGRNMRREMQGQFRLAIQQAMRSR